VYTGWWPGRQNGNPGLKQKKNELAHAIRNDDLVLTAPTADLQAFFVKHAEY
jgi:hypothetical protein